MVVLVDTNVILDYLMMRGPFFEASFECIVRCASDEFDGYVALHSLPTIWYILRKSPEEERREMLEEVCGVLQVAGVSHEEVCRAIQMKDFKDFEDCLQDRCTKEVNAQYIITRNKADFAHSEVPALTPSEFLQLLKDVSMPHR